MARLTNAQLAAQLEAAHVKYEALAAKYEALKAERDGLATMLAAEVAPRNERPAQRATRVMRDGRVYDKVCVGWNRYAYREVQ